MERRLHRPSRRPTRPLARPSWLAALFLVGLAACAEPPEARLAAAREAAAAQDLDAYLLLFTPTSAEVLRGAHDAAARSRGQLAYVKSVFDVLPSGEVKQVTVRGNLALVDLEDKGKNVTLRMLKDKGHWVIDLLALDQFWAPLHERSTL